jgi:anti-repressor protein
MRDLEVIKEQEVLKKQFRIYGDVDNPLFLARDIAEVIDYAKTGNGQYDVSSMLNTVDDDEKIKIFSTINARKPTGTMGSANRMFLTENGIYEVLMQSRLPKAKEFKKEVKKILKSIRQTGGYIPIQESDDEESIMAKALLIAQKTLDKKDALLKQQQEKIEQDKPKVEFADSVSNSKDCKTIGDFAKILCDEGIDIGRNRLFRWLRARGYLMDNNIPYQQFMKYFNVVEKSYVVNGEDRLSSTTLINGKGQIYFHKKVEEYFGMR